MTDWRAWINERGPAIVAFARTRVGSHAAAEEAVQDAFARFWPRRADVDDPAAYLYQCVRTAAIDAAERDSARRQREAAVAVPEAVFCTPDPDSEALARSVAALPREQAEMVTLKHWAGLTLAQAAAIVGCPPGTAASRYRTAVQTLRRTLNPEDIL